MDEIDQLDFIDAADRSALRELSREIIRKRVTLFAGAGLSVNAPRRDGGSGTLPLWGTLAEKLRDAREQHGAESIFHYRSGGSLGLMKQVTDTFFERFARTSNQRKRGHGRAEQRHQ